VRASINNQRRRSKVNILERLLATWMSVYLLIFAYGFWEINGGIHLEIRWTLFCSWLTIGVIGFLIWMWKKI
jgi:hypothetical protein